MLTAILRATFLTATATSVVLGLSLPAFADGGTGGVNCDTNPVPGCDVDARIPAETGDNPDRGSSIRRQCRDPGGAVIPCEREGAWAGDSALHFR